MDRTIDILFLGANSSDESRRRMEQEAREIEHRIALGKYAGRFKFHSKWAVRPGDIAHALLKHQPHIVHFSGRGSPNTGIVIEDDSGNAGNSAALPELLNILKDNIRLALFNASYSDVQARELTPPIDYSIGMDGPIDDEAAISFAAFFYQALVYARTANEAFDLAKLQLSLEKHSTSISPTLHIGPSVNSSQPFLASVGKPAADLLTSTNYYGRMARESLEPYILPRIARRIVREKYVPAIRRGLDDERQRIIPIIGPAGYGKSTLLGDIFDQLTEIDVGWIAVVRCNDLTLDDANISVDHLSVAIGEVATSIKQPFTESAGELTRQHGNGVLLVDTLDLILNQRLMVALRWFLIQLADTQTTVVLTCRDYEYNAFFEPLGQRLAGLIETIDRYTVPEFTVDEIAQATAGFVQAMPDAEFQERGPVFIESVLQLSSDSRSLREIISNPLLLAMLCELFGADGIVPRDLTVSKLYNQYWEEKITRSRKYRPQSPETIQKARICLDIGRSLFDLTQPHFKESIFESDLELTPTPGVSAAYAELFSEGVLKMRPSGRVSFFHQTFLEYTIARWLLTRSGQEKRTNFFYFLRENEVASRSLHWWSVLRQLLTVADSVEFDSFIGELDLRNLATFRAVAYAAASHADASLIRKLLPQALELGDEYQRILSSAIEGASASLAEAVWEVTVELVAQSKWRNAVRAAQTAGTLVGRRGNVVGRRLAELFNAIDRRELREDSIKPIENSRATLFGWFLSAVLAAANQGIESDVLELLREVYPEFNESHRLSVIRLHLTDGVSSTDQRQLLELTLKERVSKRLKEALTDLLEPQVPMLIRTGDTIFGTTLPDVIHARLPNGWDKIQAKAVGRQLTNNHSGCKVVIHDLFHGAQDRISRNQTALAEGIEKGAADSILRALIDIPIETIPEDRITVFVSICRAIATSVDAKSQQQFVTWLKPLLERHPEKLASGFINIFNNSPLVFDLLFSLLAELPRNQRAELSRRLMRDASDATLSALADKLEQILLRDLPNIPTQMALVELHGFRAKSCEHSLQELLKLAQAKSDRVARTASKKISQVAHEAMPLNVEDLLPLAKSRVVGVRLNCVGALTALVDRGSFRQPEEVAQVFIAFENEKQEPVLQGLCHLLQSWVRLTKSMPPVVTSVLERFINRLVTMKIAGPGTLRSIIIALKVIAQTEVGSIEQISSLARMVFVSTNVEKINDGESEAIDLLSAVVRLDSTFLARLVDECDSLPWRNARAVAGAIKRVEGPNSQLLDRILNGKSISPEVKNFILELRGL